MVSPPGLTQLAVASSPATYLPSFSLLEAKKGWIGDWEWDEAYNNITTFNVSYILCSRLASYNSAL